MNSPSIEEKIQQLFTSSRWTLSVAESCTGGAISARLTSLPGASQYFLGGVIAYSNSLKQNLLHVESKTLKEKGAVSEETVKEMVYALFSLTDAEFAVSISGIAGPDGGTAGKPVGTIWCAACRRGKKAKTWELHLKGSREAIIQECINTLLENLLSYAQLEINE